MPAHAPVAAGVAAGVGVEGAAAGAGAGADRPAQFQVNDAASLMILRTQLTEADEHPARAFVHALVLEPVFITLPFRNAL